MLLLAPETSNTPLFGLCLLPFAPAMAAAVRTYAGRAGADDLTPVRYFVSSLRVTLWRALAVGGTALAVTVLLAMFATNAGRLGLGGWYLLGSLLAAVVIAVWTVQATALVALTRLSWVNSFRAALEVPVSSPMASVGALMLIVANVSLLLFTLEPVPILCAWLSALILYKIMHPYVEASGLAENWRNT